MLYVLLVVLICCVLVALIPYWVMVLGYIFYYNPPVQHREMVCCAYNEDLRWLHRVAASYDTIYLYMKNEKRLEEVRREFFEENIKIIPFENIGSCDHIYLYHIITHYDTLADEMSFIKGMSSSFEQKKYKYFYIPLGRYYIFKQYYAPESKFPGGREEWLSFFITDYQFRWNPEVVLPFEISGYRSLGDFLDRHFTSSEKARLLEYGAYGISGGNFIVRKDNIKRYPKELYERLLDTQTPGPNRLVDHYQERLWGLMYSNIYPNTDIFSRSLGSS